MRLEIYCFTKYLFYELFPFTTKNRRFDFPLFTFAAALSFSLSSSVSLFEHRLGTNTAAVVYYTLLTASAALSFSGARETDLGGMPPVAAHSLAEWHRSPSEQPNARRASRAKAESSASKKAL